MKMILLGDQMCEQRSRKNFNE